MEDTIVAISTNNIGIGAINIIRMSGTDALKVIAKIFTNQKILNAPSHTIHYGYIIDKKEKIDEVLVTIMKGPKTYTTEDIIEINCHGGYAVTNRILKLILEQNVRLALPGEFTKRAYLNGRINLLEAEGINDILEAETENQTALAMNHLTGKTTKLIKNLKEEITKLLANIEVNIDYPEYTDELLITKEILTPKLQDISQQLIKIIKESQNGQIIKNGIKIAIVGKPNVGKSSLLNALLEEEKAIVTDISGTTRDIIEGNIVYNGILLEFIDTAGIRTTTNLVEQIGVEKTKEQITKADITIIVLNNNEQLNDEEKELLNDQIKTKKIIFINKCDLQTKLNNINYNYPIIKGSVKNNQGLEELKQTILKQYNLTDLSQKNLTYLSNNRQISLAKIALEHINQALKANQNNVPIDMVEIDLKIAWENLSKILGEYYEDELIDNIFANFCLGK